jgi:hypothetical protein
MIEAASEVVEEIKLLKMADNLTETLVNPTTENTSIKKRISGKNT